MGVILAVTFFISLCKGGRGLDSIIGIKSCSLGYWIINGIFFVNAFFLLFILKNLWQTDKVKLKRIISSI